MILFRGALKLESSWKKWTFWAGICQIKDQQPQPLSIFNSFININKFSRGASWKFLENLHIFIGQVLLKVTKSVVLHGYDIINTCYTPIVPFKVVSSGEILQLHGETYRIHTMDIWSTKITRSRIQLLLKIHMSMT